MEKFSKEKIFLVGFSWGGFLGLHFANEHPELLHAYISVSSMIHQDKSEQLTLELLQEKADNSVDRIARDEISKISIPFDSWEALYFQRKWTAEFLNKEKFDSLRKRKQVVNKDKDLVSQALVIQFVTLSNDSDE